MRLITTAMLLLLTLGAGSARAAEVPQPAQDTLPVAQWLRLPYRQQIRYVQAAAAAGGLELCRKQVAETVNCMRELGPTPAWKDGAAAGLFAECADMPGDTARRCDKPARPAPPVQLPPAF